MLPFTKCSDIFETGSRKLSAESAWACSKTTDFSANQRFFRRAGTAEKPLHMRSKFRFVFPPFPFSKWRTANQQSTRHCHGSWQHLARSRYLWTTRLLWAITRADVLTVIERIETVFSVLSGDKDSSSRRKLSAFPTSCEVPFFPFLRSCQVL